MDFLAKARRLESKIARTLDLAAEAVVGRSARQPVEIVQAVVEAAEQQVQPAGRGRRVFPFNRLIVHVLASTRSQKAQFDAVAEGPPSLRERVVQRLESAGCQVPALELQVIYASRAKPGWQVPEYHVTFERVDGRPAVDSPPAAHASPGRIDLAVVAGSAERRTYSFAGDRIDIGRRAEVLDHRQQLIRRNHIAFTEGEAQGNPTVSRKHAHIAYDQAAREYRVRDDGSARGTAVLRGGQTIRVPRGSRGVRLESGDEIALGEARVRVKLR